MDVPALAVTVFRLHSPSFWYMQSRSEQKTVDIDIHLSVVNMVSLT